MMDLTVVEGSCEDLSYLKDDSVDLVMTSPPYFSVKDYSKEDGCIGGEPSYYAYLEKMERVFKELYRTLKVGRYCVINIGDILIDGVKFPIFAHYIVLLQRCGFIYSEDIIWRKPKIQCGGASSRFGVMMQNPYPRYYYPNCQYEHCLVFRKGRKPSYPAHRKEYEVDTKKIIGSKDLDCYDNDVWYINPVNASTLKHAAPYPDELPKRFVEVYSIPGEIVLDPFLGSGTTMKVAKSLDRSCVGYEINSEYIKVIKERVGWKQTTLLQNNPITYKHLRGKKDNKHTNGEVSHSKLQGEVLSESINKTDTDIKENPAVILDEKTKKTDESTEENKTSEIVSESPENVRPEKCSMCEGTGDG